MKLYCTCLFTLFIFGCKEKEAKPLPQTVPAVIQEEKHTLASKRANIIAFAKEQLGIKYAYACSDPAKGFDCSGFVYYVFSRFDIDVPRSSQGFETVGPALSPEDFRIGDVVVFYGYRDRNTIGHVGIICEADGLDSKFIHASSGSEMAVIISSLSSDAYRDRFIKCVNVLE